METIEPVWLEHLEVPLKNLKCRIDQHFEWLHSQEKITGALSEFIIEYVSRYIQEATAYLRCIEVGVEVASIHHARLILESFAGLSFVLSDMKSDPVSIDKKLEKWRVFPEIRTYIHFQTLINRFEQNQLTEKQLRLEYQFELEQVKSGASQYSKETKDNWCQLFEFSKTENNKREILLYKNFKKIDYWHFPKRLTDLMDQEIPKVLREYLSQSDFEKFQGWHELYRYLSQLTHPNHFATKIMSSGRTWSLKIDPSRYTNVQVTIDLIELVGKISWLIIFDTAIKPKPVKYDNR